MRQSFGFGVNRSACDVLTLEVVSKECKKPRVPLMFSNPTVALLPLTRGSRGAFAESTQ